MSGKHKCYAAVSLLFVVHITFTIILTSKR